MTQYIALVTDLTGRYAHVEVHADTWDNAIDQLEDAGCEVIEDQSDDYEGCFPEELREAGVLMIDQLLTESNFVSHY
jgi:hypothetical protein